MFYKKKKKKPRTKSISPNIINGFISLAISVSPFSSCLSSAITARVKKSKCFAFQLPHVLYV